MITLLDVVRRTTGFFETRGVECARLNVERLLSEPELEAIRPLVRRRGQREPLAYVLGTAAFRDLELKVDPRVLVPRPETEQLVDLVRDRLPRPPGAILDLGTGSGALVLALARAFPDAAAVAVDASEEALAVARENAVRCSLDGRVQWLHGDWFAATEAGVRFDLIVANPPYLTESEWATAAPEVRLHEPRSALVSGDCGCADLLAIVGRAGTHLAPGGWLFLETGIDQHGRLLPALTAAGFESVESHQDWSGRDRFVSGRWPDGPDGRPV
jgi:release factor glutamine methyltransferase